jgi:hypothetical protein
MTGDPSKIVRLPDFDNRDEVSNFYKKLGRPETTEGYKLEQGENDDEEATGLFKQIAYKNGFYRFKTGFCFVHLLVILIAPVLF